MAEIKRTETRVQLQSSYRSKELSPVRETVLITTVVRSVHGSDVNVVRDFVAALDVAEAPGNARVEANRDTVGHLTGLTARWETTVDQLQEDA